MCILLSIEVSFRHDQWLCQCLYLLPTLSLFVPIFVMANGFFLAHLQISLFIIYS